MTGVLIGAEKRELSKSQTTHKRKMSDLPIPPQRFALALRDLPLSSLALKVAELRNSIAHLDYSNDQLQPFAYPSSSTSQATLERAEGDPDCINAIRENIIIIDRMTERILLVKVEVESRGYNWAEFSGPPASSDPESTASALSSLIHDTMENGVSPSESDANRNVDVALEGDDIETDNVGEQRHPAWSDGTFQTGRISAGQVISVFGRQGGRLGDEELRQRIEERIGVLEDEDDGDGMHL